MTVESETSTASAYLDPSPLGTKEYWDNLYSKEIVNFTQDVSDEGTVWFDDSAAEEKLIEFLNESVTQSITLEEHVNKENCSILDLGTGNGHLLYSLREDFCDESINYEGWNGRMLGVDYSEKSIEFAKKIGKEKKGREIEFVQWDILTSDPIGVVLTGENVDGWDVVLDKGTFDAISLSSEKDSSGQRICVNYRKRILPLLRHHGIFLITSCNWTEEELRRWFHGPDLVFIDAIRYKRFYFGGHEGQTISSVCFQRK